MMMSATCHGAKPRRDQSREGFDWSKFTHRLYERTSIIVHESRVPGLRPQGKLDEALTAYRYGLAIVERLAAADRSDTKRQRDLSSLSNGVGNVVMAQGKLMRRSRIAMVSPSPSVSPPAFAATGRGGAISP
jgi:hypothetical protein